MLNDNERLKQIRTEKSNEIQFVQSIIILFAKQNFRNKMKSVLTFQ